MRDGLSVNPARIDGGSPNNVVPDLAVLRVNLRPRDLDDQAAAQGLIETTVAAVAAEHDVAIASHGHFARPPKPMTPALEALVRSWSARPAPTSASRSPGNRPAGCATATTSPPAASP